MFAQGQQPAFKMVLTSLSPSGVEPSGQSHFAISTEERQIKPPNLSITSRADMFRQTYQLGGVSGMRSPEAVFRPKALTANDIETISRHHLNQEQDYQRQRESYKYVQY